MYMYYFYVTKLNPSLAFTQISTRVGWLRFWMLTCWWRPGRDKLMSCPPTALCPNTSWTSRGSSFLDQSGSSPITTTQSGACHGPMRTRWPAWGISTGRRPKCGVVEGWSAPLTPWFTRPSDRWLTGTLAVKWERNMNIRGIIGLGCFHSIF